MRFLSRFLTLLAVSIFTSSFFVSCLSNSSRSKSSQGSLTIKDAKSKWRNGISIQNVNAEVVVTGNIAETTLDLTIHNSTSRVLEASLDLPLPEGASISRYALEVNGAMREGVIVDKEKGRVAFENTIRQNIDPGLLEKTKGNNFRTRIYPVPAKGTKRVLLSYTEPMQSHLEGVYHYTLPLMTKRRVSHFSLRMVSNEAKTQIYNLSRSSKVYSGLNGSLHYAAKNTKINNPSFSIHSGSSPQATIQKGNDGRHYFYVSKALPAQSQTYNRSKVRRLHLIWDSSHSARLRDHKAELEVLANYLRYHQNVSVDLSYLSNSISKKQRYTVKNGNSTALRNRLESTIYDGATRLEKLDLRGSGYDAVLYVGDAMATLGESSVRSGTTPIFAVNSSPQANHNLLNQLAKKTNGAYVNLVNNPLKQPYLPLVTQTYQLLKVSGSGVTDMELYNQAQVSSVVGRMTAASGSLKLHYGTNGKVQETETVKLSRTSQKRGGTMAAKLWAQSQVDKLSINKKKNKKRIIALAKTHHLVTDFTSLIVLDRISDYVRYRIVPPTAKLRKDYYKRLKDEPESDQGGKANLDHVYKNWKRMKQWHQAKFPLKKGKYSSNFDWRNHEWDDDEFQGADFSAPVFAPSLPLAVDQSVSNIATGGLRSGDIAVTRDSIDAFLNNPNRPKTIGMKLKGWTPDTPYTREMNAAVKQGKPLLPVYLKWKKTEGASSGFYMDAAEIFLKAGQRTHAKRVLSNLAELNPESAELLRILAYRYSQMGEHALAEMILREVIELRGEEPQSYRDLALALAKRKRYTEANQLLWKIVTTKWESRFDGIKMTVLNEWNQIMRVSGKVATKSQRRFRYNIDADLRVVITWDTDNSDMDLWVTGPDGEKCYYGNTITKRGGKISRDFTRGRGPEEFMIRRSMDGKYKIQANYYGTRQQTLIGPTTLHAKLITNWNRPNQKEKSITIRLGKDKEVIDIGEFSLK